MRGGELMAHTLLATAALDPLAIALECIALSAEHQRRVEHA